VRESNIKCTPNNYNIYCNTRSFNTVYVHIELYNVTQRNKMADKLSILLQGTQVVFRG